MFGAQLFEDECSYIIIIATITKSKIKSSLGPMLSTYSMKVEDECGDIPMVLVQNKIDLISQSEIDQ